MGSVTMEKNEEQNESCVTVDKITEEISPILDKVEEKEETNQTVDNTVDKAKTELISDDETLKINPVEDQKYDEIPSTPLKQKQLLIDEMLSSEFSSDIDSDMPLSAIPNDYRIKRSKKLPSPVRTYKTSEPPQSLDEKENLLPITETPMIKTRASPEKLKNNSAKVLRHHRIHKQASATQIDESDCSDSSSSEDEYYVKKPQRPPPLKIPNQNLLINLDDDPQLREKSPRKIERTDTVIYKGPKEKNLLDLSNNDLQPSSPPLSPIVINSPSTPVILPTTPCTDVNHLKVPGVNLKDIVPNSPFPPGQLSKATFDFPDDVRVAQMLLKKFRQTCMMDLMKIIDSKMMHHHSHSESTKRRKHLHQSMVAKRNQTPSPDSTKKRMTHHRRSRSRSPESHSPTSSSHHHHHHHLPSSPLATHSLSKHPLKNHHDSNENIKPTAPSTPEVSTPQSAVKILTTSRQTSVISKSELLEMHDLKTHPAESANEIIDYISTIEATTNLISETKITNTANATDNLCVSHSPSTNRQQNQETGQNQVPAAPPVSPIANHHQKVVPVAHSPLVKTIPAIPLHRRSSDSDLSITPKGQFIQ